MRCVRVYTNKVTVPVRCMTNLMPLSSARPCMISPTSVPSTRSNGTYDKLSDRQKDRRKTKKTVTRSDGQNVRPSDRHKTKTQKQTRNSIRTFSMPTTVTFSTFFPFLSAEASSIPMKDEPMTTTFASGAAELAITAESSMVRN